MSAKDKFIYLYLTNDIMNSHQKNLIKSTHAYISTKIILGIGMIFKLSTWSKCILDKDCNTYWIWINIGVWRLPLQQSTNYLSLFLCNLHLLIIILIIDLSPILGDKGKE